MAAAVAAAVAVADPDVLSGGGPDAAFRARVAVGLREARDAAIDKLRAKYQPKLDAIESKQRTAEARIAREQAQAQTAMTDSAITIGASVLGALFGGRRATATRVASAARSVSRTAGQRGDVARAKEAAETLAHQHAELEARLSEDIAALHAKPDPAIGKVEVLPRKGDTAVTRVALLWLPVG